MQRWESYTQDLLSAGLLEVGFLVFCSLVLQSKSPLAESLRVLWEGVNSSIKRAGSIPSLDSAVTALSGSFLPVSSTA